MESKTKIYFNQILDLVLWVVPTLLKLDPDLCVGDHVLLFFLPSICFS